MHYAAAALFNPKYATRSRMCDAAFRPRHGSTDGVAHVRLEESHRLPRVAHRPNRWRGHGVHGRYQNEECAEQPTDATKVTAGDFPVLAPAAEVLTRNGIMGKCPERSGKRSLLH
jgi:hypothetical protein